MGEVLEQLQPLRPVGEPDRELVVERAGGAQGGGHLLRLGGRADDGDLPAGHGLAQRGEQYGDERSLVLARGDGLDVLEEQHRRCGTGRLGEQGRHLLRRGGRLEAGQLRRPGAQQPRPDGGGHGFDERGLARAGRAGDEHPHPGRGAQPREQVAVVEAEVEPLGQRGDLALQAGQVGGCRAGACRCGGRHHRGRAAGRRRTASPADDGRHRDQCRPRGHDVQDGEQHRGPRRSESRGQAAAGPHDVKGTERREVLRQQRHVVAGRQHLAEQGAAQHGGVDGRHHRGVSGDGDAHRLRGRCRCELHAAAVGDAEVAQHQVVAQQLTGSRARRGDRGERPRRTTSRDQHGVPHGQAEGGEHARVQPDDAAARVQGGGVQRRCEGQHRANPRAAPYDGGTTAYARSSRGAPGTRPDDAPATSTRVPGANSVPRLTWGR